MITPVARLLAPLALVAPLALAQAPAPSSDANQEPEPLPRVDPADELKGAALVSALREGGLVLYLRHADQGKLRQPRDCAVKQLTDEGEAQARKVGEALRKAGARIGTFLTSPFCRARQTADLLGFGEARIEPALTLTTQPDVREARTALLAVAPPAGTNTLLVSHVHGSQKSGERLFIERGGIVAFRPDGKGGATPVARIPPQDWDAILAATAKSGP